MAAALSPFAPWREISAPRPLTPGPAGDPKPFTAEFAKVAMVHQVSTTWAPARRGSAAGGQHLGQNAPDCATASLRQFLVDIGDFFAALACSAVKMRFPGWARIALTHLVAPR